ncbi:unnamed protein product [Hermetia illucens]|uniref:Zinc transporter ZIP1 n=1 Tax=Hermetia illucens TaxID=343691 RepID=A0A7R8YZM6_HERIL|nr:zinc transporter ZIP1-like isoform X2 [Hermetia illucens]CAD7087916.1 unnamed protein product [Hermetia illucens]
MYSTKDLTSDTNFAGLLLHSRAAHVKDDDQSVTVAKGFCILILLVASAICGYLPFVLDRCFALKNSDPSSRTGIVLRVLLYFGGGCLIGITFQHIVVEVSESVAELQASGRLAPTAFDLTLFLMCVGFMTMFLIEELIHMYVHHHEHKMAKAEDSVAKVQNGDSVPSISCHGYQRKAVVDVHLPPKGGENESMLISSLRGLLVVLALSLHALFEGLAVGLQPTADQVWTVTGAVSGHKLVLAFVIGIELIAAKVRPWLAYVYVFIFIIVAPIGIAIGIGVTSSESAVVPSVIIQGLASGTLLYAAFFEILFKERSGLWTYAGFVLGFFTIYAIIVGTHTAKKPVYCESTVVFPTTPSDSP